MKFLNIIIALLLLNHSLFANETGVLYLKKVKGGLGWFEKGNEKKHWKYTGEIKNGKPDGTGVLNSTFGKYVGELKNGKLHGLGTYTYKSGRTSIGIFKRGKPWNLKRFSKDGKIEEEWENGKKVKIFSKDGKLEEELVDGKKIDRDKIETEREKDASDFKENFRVRLLFGEKLMNPKGYSGEASSSNSIFSLIWKNFGLGLNQATIKVKSDKNNVEYVMKNSSFDISYTLFVEEYSLTTGLGYVFDGKGEITVTKSNANYTTENVLGYGIFGIIGTQWHGIEALMGVRYNSSTYEKFKGTNTTEVLTETEGDGKIGKSYFIRGSILLLGIGYNF